MNIIADSADNGISLENPVIASDSERYFAKIKESTLAFLRCGRSFDLEWQRLQAEQGTRQGTRLFKEMLASHGWWYKSATEAIDLSRRYWALSDEVRLKLDGQPQWWSIEGLKKLLKLSVGQIQKVLAQAAAQLGNSLSRFLKPFVPKKYLTAGEPITEENWPAIAELITQKLGLDQGQIEKIQLTSQALAQGEDLNTDHLVIALSRSDYDIDKLFPPPKAKAYKPEEIERIKQETKAQALTEAREQVMAEIQPRLKALEDERASDRTLIEQLQEQLQQLQTLIQRSPQPQANSTVGAQAIATLLKTGESHQALTVPSSTSNREFPGAQHNSPQKVNPSQQAPSSNKGFGQFVNQKHRR